MNDSVLVAILALIGTIVGSFGGILTANKLTNYRIQQLEEKVDKHNKFAERMPVLENDVDHLKHEFEEIRHELHNN